MAGERCCKRSLERSARRRDAETRANFRENQARHSKADNQLGITMSGFPGWRVNRTQLNRDGENRDGENGDHQPAQFHNETLGKMLN